MNNSSWNRSMSWDLWRRKDDGRLTYTQKYVKKRWRLKQALVSYPYWEILKVDGLESSVLWGFWSTLTMLWGWFKQELVKTLSYLFMEVLIAYWCFSSAWLTWASRRNVDLNKDYRQIKEKRNVVLINAKGSRDTEEKKS